MKSLDEFISEAGGINDFVHQLVDKNSPMRDELIEHGHASAVELMDRVNDNLDAIKMNGGYTLWDAVRFTVINGNLNEVTSKVWEWDASRQSLVPAGSTTQQQGAAR